MDRIFMDEYYEHLRADKNHDANPNDCQQRIRGCGCSGISTHVKAH